HTRGEMCGCLCRFDAGHPVFHNLFTAARIPYFRLLQDICRCIDFIPDLERSHSSLGRKEGKHSNLKAMQTASKKVIRGWAMYDWANSVYNLVITTTFFPIYFTAITKKTFGSDTVPFLGRKFINSSLYDYSLALAYLFIALLYPVLTSIADTRGNKKAFMKFFCYMGSAGCALLYFFNGTNLWLGILCFMMASMG